LEVLHAQVPASRTIRREQRRPDGDIQPIVEVWKNLPKGHTLCETFVTDPLGQDWASQHAEAHPVDRTQIRFDARVIPRAVRDGSCPDSKVLAADEETFIDRATVQTVLADECA
jgi:hypothetical protein